MRYTPSLIVILWSLLAVISSDAQSWQWAVGNTGANTDGWPVATDKFGNVFCAGTRSGSSPAVFGKYTVPFSGGSAGYQCLVAKYDPNGNFQWAMGNTLGEANLIGIATDPAGDVFMFGSFDSGTFKIASITLTNTYRRYTYKYFLTKIDPLGNVLWAVDGGSAQSNFVNIEGIFSLLGLGSVATDLSGNVYITANFSMPAVNVGSATLTNTDPSGFSDDILVAKYDGLGNMVWARSIGGSKSDDAYAMTVTPAGNVYIAGNFSSPSIIVGASAITNTSTAQIAFIAQFDALGNPVWASASGGQGNEFASGLASDAAGNVYLIGGFADNNISFNGTVITNPYPGYTNLYLVKFDPSNNVLWDKTIGSPANGYAWGYSVAVSSCGYVWVCGGLEGAGGQLPAQVSVDGNSFITPDGSYDPVFLAGYTPSGSFMDCQLLQSGGDDEDGLACDASGNVFLCGDYWTNSPFSIGGTHFPADTHPYEFLYLAKYAPAANPNNFTHSDTFFCFTPGILLNAPPGYASYIWSDGKGGPAHSVSDTGLLWVRGDDSCGIYMLDTFRVNSFCDCNKYLFIPNSFTPNGDGQNDVFYPRSGNNNIKIKAFRIYNRWGELVFERENILANDATNGWDGTFMGSQPLSDVYVYIVEAVCEDGTPINKKGSVNVIK